MRRVERIGVQIDGHIRHYHPMSLIYAIRVGAWQVLAMDSADNVPVLVTVEHGEDGRDCLSARSPDGANLLNVLAPCADEA